MNVFKHPENNDHEQVVFCRAPEAGLTAIIAIHSTKLGPAAGGCRMYPYASESDALTDVLRLSRGMTYKNALAGLPLGGGKSVIIGDPHRDKSPELLHAFGRFIASLSGRYWTAEDVGIGEADVEAIATVNPYTFGLVSKAQRTGDPSPYTARGGFQGVRAAARHRFEREDISGLTIAVQGVGATGFALAKMLREAGADVIVSDTNAAAVSRAQAQLGVRVAAPDQIYDVEADIFAPCAMGASINAETLPRLKVKAIAGVANNQLATPDLGEVLMQRGIAYAPDFVVNAGGMLSASGDILGRHDVADVLRRIDGIYEVALNVLDESKRRSRPAQDIAIELAEARLAAA